MNAAPLRSTSTSAVIGSVARFIDALEKGGVTPADMQRVVNNRDFRKVVLDAFGHPVKEVSLDITLSELSIDGARRLVKDACRLANRRANMQSYDNRRPEIWPTALLRQPDMAALAAILDQTELRVHQVAVLAYGLAGEDALDYHEVASRLSMRPVDARDDISIALNLVALDMKANPGTWFAELPVGTVTSETDLIAFMWPLSDPLKDRLYSARRSLVFRTVGELLERELDIVHRVVTWDDLQDRPVSSNGEELFAELQAKLAEHGFVLGQDVKDDGVEPAQDVDIEDI